MGFHTLKLGRGRRESEGECSSLWTSGSLFATCHSTRSPHARHRTTAGRKSHLQPGLANSRFRTGSATRVPGDSDFQDPAIRSTGFKIDLIPQQRGCLLQIQEGCRLRRNFPQCWDGPRGRFGFAGRGLMWAAKPLRQVFLLFFARRRARVLSRSGRDGQP